MTENNIPLTFQFGIESNVPIPPKKSGKRSKYEDMKTMAHGEYICVSKKEAQAVRNACHKLNVKITARTIKPGDKRYAEFPNHQQIFVLDPEKMEHSN